MILVTGATGLLGSHLLYELIQNKELGSLKIVAVYRSESKIKEVEQLFNYYNPTSASNCFNQIIWKQGDLTDLVFLNDLFIGVTHVYHCAAKVSFFKSDFSECMLQNREVTANIVNFSLKFKVEKLCYVSSTAAVGSNKNGLTTENDKWEKDEINSGYSISKYSAEKEVWRGIEEGLNAVIINPCVILGPGNWNSGSMTIFKTASNGVLFYPSGANATVDARDVAFCMRELMQSTIVSERFLCTGSNQSFKDLFSTICFAMGTKTPKYAVNKSIALFISFIAEIVSRLLKNRIALSTETVLSAFRKVQYDSSKIQSQIPVKFHTSSETVENVLKARTLK